MFWPPLCTWDSGHVRGQNYPDFSQESLSSDSLRTALSQVTARTVSHGACESLLALSAFSSHVNVFRVLCGVTFMTISDRLFTGELQIASWSVSERCVAVCRADVESQITGGYAVNQVGVGFQ